MHQEASRPRLGAGGGAAGPEGWVLGGNSGLSVPQAETTLPSLPSVSSQNACFFP